MPVDTKNKSYSENKPIWDRNRDAAKGSDAIKAGGTKYLPKPMPDDKGAENTARYKSYLERANFVNFTGSTKEGMLGMVFRKEVITDLTGNLEYLTTNVDGSGLTLDQMARGLISDILDTGRDGILTDYPKKEGSGFRSRAEDTIGGANLITYKAEDIINWKTTVIDGVKALSMVVLREPTEIQIADDEFDVEEKLYHRALLLNDGVYIQRLYDENNNLIVHDNGVTDIIPTTAKGQTWDRIPFVFVGSVNNDEVVDKAPLTDLAVVNIAHYRNSADYEESSFMVGQPTPYAVGLDKPWVDEVIKDNEVRIGSREFLLLPEGGGAGLLQASPNTMPQVGMVDKEKQMIRIGARVITDTTGNETAEAAKIRFAGQNSKLGVIVGNVQAAILKSIEFASVFMGVGSKFDILLNAQFYDKSIEPQAIIAQIQLLDRGIIAKTDLRTTLRKTGSIESDRTDDQIDSEAESNVMD